MFMHGNSIELKLYIAHLWNETEDEKDSGEQDDPSREYSSTDVDVAPQNEGDEHYHHQYYTGDVYESRDGLGVVQNGDPDFAGLEGEDDADQLEETEVDKDEEVQDKRDGA